MGKVLEADKMQIQTLREQRLGAKAVTAAYPDKDWTLSSGKKICQRVDWTGLATECKASCGRPKSVRCEANIAAVIFKRWKIDRRSSYKVYNFVVFQQNHISRGS